MPYPGRDPDHKPEELTILDNHPLSWYNRNMGRTPTTTNDRNHKGATMTETYRSFDSNGNPIRVTIPMDDPETVTNKDGIEGIVMSKVEFDATTDEMISIRLDEGDEDYDIYETLLDYFPEQVAEVRGDDTTETFEEALTRKCAEWDAAE